MKVRYAAALIALGMIVCAERPAPAADVAQPRPLDALLEVVGCTTDTDCERKDRALQAERRACIKGSARACGYLNSLHAIACKGDTDSDDCAMHR